MWLDCIIHLEHYVNKLLLDIVLSLGVGVKISIKNISYFQHQYLSFECDFHYVFSIRVCQ